MSERHDDKPSDALLPCPCCGSKAEFKVVPYRDEVYENEGGEYVECSSRSCGVTTRLIFPLKGDVKRELAEVWNNRTPSSAGTAINVTELLGGGIVSCTDSFTAIIAAQWPAIQQEARDYIRRIHMRDGAERDDQKEKFAQAVLASTPQSATEECMADAERYRLIRSKLCNRQSLEFDRFPNVLNLAGMGRIKPSEIDAAVDAMRAAMNATNPVADSEATK